MYQAQYGVPRIYDCTQAMAYERLDTLHREAARVRLAAAGRGKRPDLPARLAALLRSLARRSYAPLLRAG